MYRRFLYLIAGLALASRADACKLEKLWDYTRLPPSPSNYMGEIDWRGADSLNTPAMRWDAGSGPCTYEVSATGAAALLYGPIETREITEGAGEVSMGYLIAPNMSAGPRKASVRVMGIEFYWTQLGNPNSILEQWIRSYPELTDVTMSCLADFARQNRQTIDWAFASVKANSYNFWQAPPASYLYGLIHKASYPLPEVIFRVRIHTVPPPGMR